MGNQAKIIDSSIFEELKTALAKFECEASASAESAYRVIGETRNWLEERFSYWSSEVNRKRQDLQKAQDDLKRCQSTSKPSSNDNGKKERQKDCSAEAQAVIYAKRALYEVESRLEVTKKWKDNFTNLESNFRAKVQGFKQSLNSLVAYENKNIASSQSNLERYLQNQLTSIGASGLILATQQPFSEVQENLKAQNDFKSDQLSEEATEEKRGWTRQDGSGFHQLVEETVEEKYDQTAVHDDPKSDRTVESEKILSDGRRIDTLITKDNKGIVIDYKTHDMANWTEAKAIIFADLYGPTIQGYTQMQNDGVPLDTQGYIVFCNNLPKGEGVFNLLCTRLSHYGVKVEVVEGAGVYAVTEAVGKIITENGM